jgi:hypothetical protein
MKNAYVRIAFRIEEKNKKNNYMLALIKISFIGFMQRALYFLSSVHD